MKIWKVCAEELEEVNDDIVIVVADSDLNMQIAAKVSSTIQDAKNTKHNVALCYVKGSTISSALNLIILSMFRCRYTSLTEIDAIDDVDEDYAASILDYETDLDELGLVLGKGLENIAKQFINDSDNPANALLSSFIDTVVKSQSEQKVETAPVQTEVNNEELESLRAENVNLQNTISDLRTKLAPKDKEINTLNQCVSDQATKIKLANGQITKLKDELSAAEDKLNAITRGAGGQVQSTTYVETKLDALKASITAQRGRIDVEHVLYFKELTPARYINSFIMNFIQYAKQNKGKNVVCLIYDRAEFTKYKYGRLPIIDGNKFAADNTIIENNSTLVITDAAPQLLQEALIKYDIVIVYDRLGAERDIIVGRNVHKFFVVNSMKEFSEIQRQYGVDAEQIITTFGTQQTSLSVRYIKDYKKMSSGGRTLAYASMMATKNETITIYEQMLLTAGISLGDDVFAMKKMNVGKMEFNGENL